MVRRLTVCVTVLAALVIAQGCAISQEKEPAPPVEIFKTAEPPKIDGVLDDECWKDAAPVQCVYPLAAADRIIEKPWMTARFAWDGRYLYIGYETFDANMQSIGSGQQQGPPGNQRQGAMNWVEGEKADVVEFFISFNDKRIFWELHHTALNQFNDVFIVVVDEDWGFRKAAIARHGIIFLNGEYIQDGDGSNAKDGAERKVALAARIKPRADGAPGTANDPSDRDTGYVGEMRLPWYGLGAPTAGRTETPMFDEDGNPVMQWGKQAMQVLPWDNMAGLEVVILSVCQDADKQEGYYHSSPTLRGGWFHKNYARYPRYVFVDKAAAERAAPAQ